MSMVPLIILFLYFEKLQGKLGLGKGLGLSVAVCASQKG